MGMFDNVNYECVCPVCKSKVDGFQSKDLDCVLETVEPQTVNNFYSSCAKCGCWLEFKRITNPTENFTRTVQGKINGERKTLNLHTKQVTI